MKQNDYLLNAISNQDFTNEDFALLGLNASNTSLESKDTYKNLDYIQNHELFQTDGVFDEFKFDTIYDAIQNSYLELSTIDAAKSIGERLAVSKYNIFGDQTKINTSDQFVIQKTLNNPLRNKSSIWGVNSISEGPLSIREIAQTQLTDNDGKYEDSPNEAGFFGDFWSTKVLATYDSDGVHTDPTTGLLTDHKKGDYKYNHNGTFYYEDLGDRDIYGKQVLSKFDIITTDGSIYNKYDFFDSDDKDKSTVGTLAKTVIKVAPAFIPYIGPWYIAARVGMNVADISTKIGKMVAGPDSPNLSAIEGFISSFGTSVSDNAQEHLWSIENILNMSGDVFLQLAEQRWLFTHLPSLLQGNKLGFSETARKTWKKRSVKDFINQRKNNLNGITTDQVLINEGALEAEAVGETNRILSEILKDNYKLGEHISRAYMTAITSASTYGEAIEAGASNTEATFFSLGFAFGENMILRSKLGDWILPELRLEKARLQKTINALYGNIQKPSSTSSKEAQLNWAKRWIKAGYDWFKEAGVDETTGKVLAKHMISNSLGEGIEETVEQTWLDMSRSIFNFTDNLLGGETYLKPTWRDKEGNLTLLNTLNDYALNFVGGMIGGGLGNLRLSINEAKNITALNSDSSAFQELVYHIREGKADVLKKIANNLQLGDNNLGTQIKRDGTLEEATESDNQDVMAKKVFNWYVDTLENLITMEKSIKTDAGISLDLIFKDLRFSKLLQSPILNSYLQNYNTAVTDMTTTALAIAPLINQDSLNSQDEEKLKNLQKTLGEQRKKVEEYSDGTQAFTFVKDAIWSMDSGVTKGYVPTNILQHIEFREASLDHDRKLSEIPKPELEEYIKEWENKSIDYIDKVRERRKWFDRINDKLSNIIQNHTNDYLNDLDIFINKVERTTDSKIIQNIVFPGSETKLYNFLQELYSNRGQDTNNSKRIIFIDNLLDDLVTKDLRKYKPLFDLFQATRRTESEGYLSEDNNLLSYMIDGLDVVGLDHNNTNYRKIITNVLSDQLGIFGDTDDTNNWFGNVSASDIVSNHQIMMDYTIKTILGNKDVVQYIIDSLQNQKYLSHTSRTFLQELFNEYSPINTQNLTEALNKIPYTPMQSFVDNVQLTLKDDNIKFSTLINALESQAYQLSKTGKLTEFGFPEVTWEEAIRHAEGLLDIAISHLSAGRTDLSNPDSPFGYNYTVNYLQKNNNLVTYNIDGFNILFNDLQKLQKELLVYRRLARNSAAQLLNSQYQIATNVLNNIITALHNVFQGLNTEPKELKNWEGSDKFKSVLDDLISSDIKTLINVEGLFTPEQKFQYASLKFKLDNAIFDFIQSNKSKTKEEFAKLFTELFPNIRNNYIIQPKSDFYEKSTNVHIKTLFSYIAAAGALRSADFIKTYINVLKNEDKFIHSEALYNALFHETSFITQKNIWDKLSYAYSEVQQADLKESENNKELLPTIGDFYNVPSSKKNSSSALTYTDCFLLTGLAGTGKSSANLTLLLKLLNNVGNLTKRIAIVHKTQVQADTMVKELAKKTGIDKSHFIAFSHDAYIKHINPNINPISASNPKVNINQLTQNSDDLTWHYQDEQELNTGVDQFSLVVYDEVTNVSYLDLNVHQHYIQKNGIRSLCLGDFNQTTLSGSFKNSNDVEEHLQLHAHNFLSTYGLFTSFRSDNKVNTQSQLNFLNFANKILNQIAVNNSFSKERGIPTQYVLNDLEFNGILALPYELDEQSNIKVSDEFKKAVDIMIKTSPDRGIMVIYDDDSDPLLQYLKSLQNQQKFNYINSVAQGEESEYAIVISRPDLIEDFSYSTYQTYFKDTYTSISRARQGTIVTNTGFKTTNNYLFTKSQKLNNSLKSVLTPDIVKEFNAEAINIYENLIKDLNSEQIKLDYDINISEQHLPSTIDAIKKEIKEFEELIKEYGKEGLTPTLDPIIYNNWVHVAREANDNEILHKLQELEQYVSQDYQQDGEGEESIDTIPYKNEDREQITAPLYSFNSYLIGVNKNLKILQGGLQNDELESNNNPSEWNNTIAAKGILKYLTKEGIDISNYYDKTRIEVTLEFIEELHKLYNQLYTGVQVSSDLIPEGYTIKLALINQNHTNNQYASLSAYLDTYDEKNPKFIGVNHRISACIMKDDSIRAEIPLYTLPNVKSLLESYGVDQAKITHIRQITSPKELKANIDQLDIPILSKLLHIFSSDLNKVQILGDLSTEIEKLHSSNGMKQIGIQVLSKEKSSSGHFEYSPKPTLLSTQVNLGQNNTNNIYIASAAFAFDSDYEYTLNNETKIIPKGKQFVVVSQNPDIKNRTDLKQLIHAVKLGSASIVYINAPVLENTTENINTILEGIINTKNVKAFSRSTILTISNAVSLFLQNSSNLEKINDSKFQDKYPKLITELIPLASENWNSELTGHNKLITNSGKFDLTNGQGLITVLRRCLNKIKEHEELFNSLIQQLQSTTDKLYFPFSRKENKKFIDDVYGYYELKVNFKQDSIEAQIELPDGDTQLSSVYTNGELRTRSLLGNITNIVNNFYSALTGIIHKPEDTEPKYYKATGNKYKGLYKVVFNNSTEYILITGDYYGKINLTGDVKFNKNPEELTLPNNKEQNLTTVGDTFIKLYENTLIDQTDYEELYIKTKFPEYTYDGTQKEFIKEEKRYKYENYQMIEITDDNKTEEIVQKLSDIADLNTYIANIKNFKDNEQSINSFKQALSNMDIDSSDITLIVNLITETDYMNTYDQLCDKYSEDIADQITDIVENNKVDNNKVCEV